jgi:hypothetical protein
MKHWEFLLQKEGDRSWLPLDSPNVEILEGRYRVVARSSQKNIEVEIRISHLATEEDPPKRRIQKRSTRTNQEGLIVVIPYTRLEPGLWELCCSSTDLMSDLVGDSWQYAVKLQVSAKEAEAEDWDSAWTPSTAPDLEANHLADSTEGNNQLASSPIVSIESIESPEQASESVEQAPSDLALTSADEDSSAEPAPSPERVTAVNEVSNLSPEVSNLSPEVADIPPEVAEMLDASMERLFQLAEQMSNRLVDEVIGDLDLSTVSEESNQKPSFTLTKAENPFSQSSEVISQAEGDRGDAPGFVLPPNANLVLKLDREALIAHRGESLTLSGQVEIEHVEISTASQPFTVEDFGSETTESWGALGETLDLTGATVQEVQLCLRDPQSLQVLVSDRQPIPDQPPPLSFSFSFSLPDDLQTRLALGEVLLCGTLAGKKDASTTLTTQAFTVTADPQELVGELEKINDALDETLTDQPERARINLPLEISQKLAKEQELPSLNLSFLTPEPEETEVKQQRRFQSLLGQPLPPQIYQPTPDQPRTKQIELPVFVFPPNQPTANTEPGSDDQLLAEDAPAAEQLTSDSPAEPLQQESEATVVESTTSELVETEQTIEAIAPERMTSDAEGASIQADQTKERLNKEAIPAGSEELESPTQEHLAESSQEAIDESEAEPLDVSLQIAFQSLNLQDRFLTRLNSLANDAELSDWLRAELYPGRGFQPAYKGSTSTDKAKRKQAEEIVVEDETPPKSRTRQRNSVKQELVSNLEELPNPLILPPDEPIPIPVLTIAPGELVSGRSVNVRVKLPYLEPRIYVKLWVVDRQTRSLLDGPRWILDFIPNSRGELEALTQLTVPFGSLEVLFEAIAIEMHTQRESHKVSVDRSVVPPDLPVVSLNDFDSRL